ncbi:MAG: Gfo/Idh/MocA family oxidoreductase [Acidobacteriota bacterium]
MAAFRPVGFAVLGMGRFAQCAILPAFRHSRKARLVAVISGDKSKAARLAKEFGASATYSYEELPLCFENPQVEAVYIATNNSSHARYAIEAAKAGRHVLCEKPMANTVEECRDMLQASRNSAVQMMIAYRKYFDPACHELKRLISAGKLGQLKCIHSGFGFLPRRKARGWRLDGKSNGGGPLADLGVYVVSTVRYLLEKEPVEVDAHIWTTDSKRFSRVEENIAFRLSFPGGVVLQATASFGAAHSSFMHVHGAKGWVVWNPAFEWDKERRLFGKIGTQVFERKFRRIEELARELDAFATSVRRQHAPEPSALQGLRDVAILTAINRAARERRPIPIKLPN